VPWSNGFSVEARQNAQRNGNQGSRQAENQPLAEFLNQPLYSSNFDSNFSSLFYHFYFILKKSAQSCPGPNPLYTTRVTKSLKNPFLIFHGHGSWPLAKSCDHENDLIFLVMTLGP